MGYKLLLALLAGAVTTLAFAPFNIWPLALITPWLLFHCLKRTTTSRSALTGWWFGVGLYGTGASWVYVSISNFSNTPIWLAALMTLAFVMFLALFFALHGALYGRFLQGSKAGFIGLWIIMEWLRSWLLTGFPWLYLGYAALDTPLSPLAAGGGVWLLSLVLIALPWLLYTLWKKSGLRRLASLVCLIIIALAAWLPQQWTQARQGWIKIDMVQANIPQNLKWDTRYLPTFLDRYQYLTEKQTTADIIVWPETAIPALYTTAAPWLDNFITQLQQNNRTLVAGLPSLERDPSHPDGHRIHNSIGVITGDGNLYHKQRLVPFGEYVPFERYLRGLIDFFNLPMSSFSLPKRQQGPLYIKEMPVAATICYEIAYPELVRTLARQSDWLLTVSNDTWFSHSIAPAQHMQIARMRAVENGRWLVRSTNNGITAFVDPQGNITSQAPSYQSAVLAGKVEPRTGQTPFQQLGSLPTLLLSLLLIIIGCISHRQHKSADRPLFK